MEQFLFLLIGVIVGFLIGKFLSESRLKNSFQNKQRNLEHQLNEEKVKNVQFQAKLETETSLNKAMNEHLKDTFEAMSAKVLKSNNESFIQLANETMKGFMMKAESDHSKRAESINHLIKPLKESLDRHEKLVLEFQSGNNKAMGSLKTYLEELSKSQKSLEKETGALVTALRNPKVRGRWGEIGLWPIKANLFRAAQFTCEQVSNTNLM